jgi:Tol biopolymer transport system component
MPASGGEAREVLTLKDAEINAVVWTRDGNSLIFADLADGKSQVWLIAVGGGEPRKLDLPVEGAISVLDVHPDGQRLAYDSRTLGGEVWVMENFLPASVGGK